MGSALLKAHRKHPMSLYFFCSWLNWLTYCMDKIVILKELTYSTARSGGAGGQHINKVETKVILSFDLLNSNGLTQQEKSTVGLKLKNNLTQEGILMIYNQETRSQLTNKKRVTSYLFVLLKKAMFKPKTRKPSRRTKSSIENRIQTKKHRSDLKNKRGKVDY